MDLDAQNLVDTHDDIQLAQGVEPVDEIPERSHGGPIHDRVDKSYGGGVPSYIPEDRVEDLARRLITFSYAVAPLVPRVKGAYAEGGSVDDPIASAVDTARNLTPMGFYSAAAEAASKFPQKAPIDQIVNKIKGQPNVKKEELDNANLADAFAGQRSVDPQEVARHLQTSVPQIREQVYGQYKYQPQKMKIPSFNKFEDAEEVHRVHGPSDRADMFIGTHDTSGESEYGVYDSSGRLHSMHEDFDDAVAAANEHLGAKTQPAQYKDYTIPGGENYREVVMHLPEAKEAAAKKVTDFYDAMHEKYGENFISSLSPEEDIALYRLQAMADVAESKQPYKSSHWHGVNNPVAHLRMSDRDNGKTLHLEELQSDWGQEGRKKGFYPNQEKEESMLDILSRAFSFDDHGVPAARAVSNIPAAPYVTDTNQWVDLGLKRALMEAAKGGYDKLIWTPGEEHFNRYGSEMVSWKKNPEGGWHIHAATQVSPFDIKNVRIKENDLNFVGSKEDLFSHVKSISSGDKEAQKLTDRIWDRMQKEDSGTSLPRKEGMEGFYDSLVPQRLNKLVAQYDKDAKVKLLDHELTTGRNTGPVSGDQVMNSLPETQGMSESERSDWWRNLSQDKRDDLFDQFRSEKKMKAHSIEITPKLRAAILKGLPAFKSGGDVGYDRGGSIIRRALDVISKLPQ